MTLAAALWLANVCKESSVLMTYYFRFWASSSGLKSHGTVNQIITVRGSSTLGCSCHASLVPLHALLSSPLKLSQPASGPFGLSWEGTQTRIPSLTQTLSPPCNLLRFQPREKSLHFSGPTVRVFRFQHLVEWETTLGSALGKTQCRGQERPMARQLITCSQRWRGCVYLRGFLWVCLVCPNSI